MIMTCIQHCKNPVSQVEWKAISVWRLIKLFVSQWVQKREKEMWRTTFKKSNLNQIKKKLLIEKVFFYCRALNSFLWVTNFLSWLCKKRHKKERETHKATKNEQCLSINLCTIESWKISDNSGFCLHNFHTSTQVCRRWRCCSNHKLI